MHGRDHVDEDLSFGSRGDGFPAAFQIAVADELFDDAGAGCRCADATGMAGVVIKCGFEVLVLEVTARVFHRRQQARFGERLGRLGAALADFRCARGRNDGARDDRVGDLPVCHVHPAVIVNQIVFTLLAVFLALLANALPSLSSDGVHGRGELNVIMPLWMCDHADDVVDGVFCDGFPHARDDAGEHQSFVLVECAKDVRVNVLGRQDGGMSGDFAVIDHELGARVFRSRLGVDEPVHPPAAVHEPVEGVEVGFGDVPAVSTGVRGEFAFIQVL